MGYCPPPTNTSSINTSNITDSGSSGEGEANYDDEVQASYKCARDDTSVTNAYAEYEGVNYAIDLMLVTLCLAVAFTRAGYTQYLKRGKNGAKGTDLHNFDDETKRQIYGGHHFHSVKWWLYETFKSQDFGESIETCFGAALNIIDLQGIEPENKGIYDWVLIVIFIQLLFVLAGENLILAYRIVWRKIQSFYNVRTKLGATQYDVETGDDDFEDTELGKFVEMIFVHLSTLILRCNLPMDPGNAVFILYAFIKVVPLFVKLIVEGKRKAEETGKNWLNWCGYNQKKEKDDEEDDKLKPLQDAMKDSFECNYLTPEFHFDHEFDKADIDNSGGLNKSEFTKFLGLLFEEQQSIEDVGKAESLFDQISQSVKQRVENQGDPRVFHERFSLTQDSIDQKAPKMKEMVEAKQLLLIARKKSISASDPQHHALETYSQLVRIVTKQDILVGCVKYFDSSSRDWLYLNQARSLLQFLKRGRVFINDQDDVMKLSDDEKRFRVMAAIDLCNGVLETHDIRLAGQFCGDQNSVALDSLADLMKTFSNPGKPTEWTKAEKFAYRTEGVAIIKANLYKVAALHSKLITPKGLVTEYKEKIKDRNGNAEVQGPWVVNLTRARNAMEQMEKTIPHGHTKAIRTWFDNEFTQYTSCKELKALNEMWINNGGIDGMREANARHLSVVSNSPPNSPPRGRPMSQVSQNDVEFTDAITHAQAGARAASAARQQAAGQGATGQSGSSNA